MIGVLKGLCLADIKELREKVAEFRSVKASETKFSPIKKWVIKELGCVFEGNRGSHQIYSHEVLVGPKNREGHIQIVPKHGGKEISRPMLQEACRRFELIIDLLEERQGDE